MPIYTLPSLRQPESISPEFYFTSSVFLNKIKFDLDRLLNAWSKKFDQPSSEPNHTSTKALNKTENTTSGLYNKDHKKNGKKFLVSQSITSKDLKKFNGEEKGEINNGQNSSHSNKSLNEGDEKEGSDSPFVTFKKVYKSTGWIYIHLAVTDIGLRKAWFNTIVRLFLDELKEKVDPIRQIGALFGLWCFWGTQPEVLNPKHYIIIDTETFEYLLSIPKTYEEHFNKKFSKRANGLMKEQSTSQPISSKFQSNHSIEKKKVHIDPSLFGDITPANVSNPKTQSTNTAVTCEVKSTEVSAPTESLVQVLSNLIENDAFLIEPKEIARFHPTLPSNSLIPENSTNPPNSPPPPPLQPAPTSNFQPSAVTQDSSSSLSQAKKPKKRNHLGELILSAKDELSSSAIEMNEWDLSKLETSRQNYLNSKSTFSIQNQTQPSTGNGNNNAEGEDEVQNDSLTSLIIDEAIGMTRKVIQKTGPGLDHLLFPNSSSSSPSSNHDENENSDSNNNNNNNNNKEFGSRHAVHLVEHSQNLNELKNAINELQDNN